MPDLREPPAALPNPYLAAREVSRRYGYRRVLTEVSFELSTGQALLLVGSNGAGKTTLLRVLAGLLRPTSGTVERHVPVGMVAHDPMLYPALTARQNLRFFARLWNLTDGGRIDALLERMDLLQRADDRAGTFSRGMIQKLSIARALLHDPKLLLFDEPLSSLDAATTEAVVELLTVLRREGTAIVIVSHQLGGLGRLATHVGWLERGRLTPPEAVDGRDPAAVAASLAEAGRA